MLKLFNKCLRAKYTHTLESGDYAIEFDGSTIYLLFQWTQGKEDWRNNFDFPATPYKRMDEVWYCHRGFLRVWKAMRDEIEAAVANIINLEPMVKNIVCVGYSHGAALALLATEDMAYTYKDSDIVISGYGFGSPRVLWGPIPKSLKERLDGFTAIRNIPDLVTHVPPAIFGFRHMNLKKIGKCGKYGLIKAHYSTAYVKELKEEA